ncbi:cytochrome c [Erythrobacter sp.]|uniref:c-type cytochrome n=1 Tax=Erythrobacter sp. TaxID=1042 RepID=UPI001425F4D9|nr:cytochrome c [Erythrobacter sp.]QIQ85258.1 MAG: cytochrome c [Erythrobacter sp.]QIQ88009.1 MAG: cytochrome c [Erythrobacter sp.]
MKPSTKGALVGAIGMLVLLLAIGLAVILTGAYNVAATDRHNPAVGWALDTAMHNGVEARAGDVGPPPQFTPAMIEAGAGEYKEYCAHCHGGVGAGKAGWAAGMRPHPPALARVADQWSEREIFWMVKHGVKMSGMPAFGPPHDDRTLWNIAAFVKAMPGMTAEQYAGFEGGHEH